MDRSRTRTAIIATALALVCALAVTGCGEHDPGTDEPAREGLAIDVDGVDYNTFITRELNLSIPPDKALYAGKPAPAGSSLYGIFIQACNNDSSKPLTPTDDFVVEDNQGKEFRPIRLPLDNPFAYHARALNRRDCIPESGSFAQQGPTAGSMLLFQFPIADTENRPLELIIRGARESKRVELDL